MIIFDCLYFVVLLYSLHHRPITAGEDWNPMQVNSPYKKVTQGPTTAY